MSELRLGWQESVLSGDVLLYLSTPLSTWSLVDNKTCGSCNLIVIASVKCTIWDSISHILMIVLCKSIHPLGVFPILLHYNL
jgi:hypothetical protein